MKPFVFLLTGIVLCLSTLVGSIALPQYLASQSLSQRFQDLFHPTVSHVVSQVTAAEASLEKFWQDAKALGKRVIDYADQERRQFVKEHPEITKQVQLFEQTVRHVGQETTKFVTTFDGIDHETLSQKWAIVMDTTYTRLQEEFPPLENATTHEQRKAEVHRTFQIVEDQMVLVLGPHLRIPEVELRHHFHTVRMVIEAAVTATGDIVELHPQATETLLFSAAIMLIPESMIIRGLLNLAGFGPAGPIKGSVAAWAQRRFWREAIKEGSWFARLQAARMGGKELVKPIWKVIGSIGLGGAVAGSFSFCGGGR